MSAPLFLPASELEARAKQSLATWMRHAERIFGRKFVMPTLGLDLKGTRAGCATWPNYRIRLNAALMLKHIEAFESDIIPHELAHVLVPQLFSRKSKPHGTEWASVMTQLGVNPKVRHSFDVSETRQSKLIPGYACNCNPNRSLTIRKHNRAVKGGRYRCLTCKTPIVYVGATVSSK